MSLLTTLTIDANETALVKLKNHNDGKPNRFSFIAYGGGGNDFGSGTVAVNVSPDSTIMIPATESGTAITFTENTARNIEVNSDENEPVYLAFVMTGSTSPTVLIKVYDNR
jgi:hypothetical protein